MPAATSLVKMSADRFSVAALAIAPPSWREPAGQGQPERLHCAGVDLEELGQAVSADRELARAAGPVIVKLCVISIGLSSVIVCPARPGANTIG